MRQRTFIVHLPSSFEDLQHFILLIARPGQVAVDNTTRLEQPRDVDASSGTELETVTGKII